MVSFIVIIIVSILFFIIFSILLGGLNKSKLRLLVPIQKSANKLKRKKLYNNLTLIVFIAIITGFREYYKLKDIDYGILLGFLFALTDITFNDEIPYKK
ncbi:hypothetical protein [Clostridium polynesiense]|uniref:hypothetical protein n=1 Tax=Clostridium polynesiense TaxID=1325933 RepID=UPI00069389F0|nr:hypothetical protein [Clostridium polynesiense]